MRHNNFYSLLLVILILVSLGLTPERWLEAPGAKQAASFLEAVTATSLTPVENLPEPAKFDFVVPRIYLAKTEPAVAAAAATSAPAPAANQAPSILNFRAQAILVSDWTNDVDLISYNVYKRWPLASLTKLMTAVVALEEIGRDKEIIISETAVATEGDSGKLKVGELYGVADLVNLMLVTSSNDAATALAEFYVFGPKNFVKSMNKKAGALGMNQTIFFDPAGLSPLNQSTASDLKKLMNYLEETQPEILAASRAENFKGLKNINPFAGQPNFGGGKTGYIEESKENLTALFSLNNQRILIVILGAESRFQQTQELLFYLTNFFNL